MDKRIFGLENEYGVTCTFRGSRRLSPDEVARYLFRRVVSWGRSSNVFLRNGARLYLDVGSHPEYATPECDNITDLVIHDKAGERIEHQQGAQPAVAAGRLHVDRGRGKHAHLDQERDDIAEVAVLHVQRRQEGADARRDHTDEFLRSGGPPISRQTR